MDLGLGGEKALYLYSDGASRGNPGPSAWAYILLDEYRNLIEERAGSIGRGTNNEAEYRGLIEGLRAALRHGPARLSVYSDSELVVRQMNGIYRVASPRLIPLYREAKSVSGNFQKIEFHSVPRDQPCIAKADQLCNAVLDRERGD
ncbi:MAG: ribonuclease HI family protein [Methanoregulaceae archaeon]|nr:ribonuclease HI family protein [Methanoregulaceae archaeon]